MEQPTVIMATDNNSNNSCFDVYDTPGNRALLGLRSSLSFVSCFFILVMIGIMVLFKKYLFFTQRLILYLAIVSFSYDFLTAFNVAAFEAHKNEAARIYCYIISFIAEQVSVWWIFNAVTCIVIDIFLKAVFELHTERLEIPYVLFSFFLPFTFGWIPFIQLSFGPAGIFCWIRTKDLNNCSNFKLGVLLQFILYYIPLYLLMAVLVIMMIVTFVFVRKKRKMWAGKTEEKRIKKMMEKEIRPLISYPFIIIAVNIFALLRRLYGIYSDTDTTYFVINLLVVITYRFQGVAITLAFILDRETRKKLNRREIRAAFQRLCQKETEVIKEYPMEVGRSDSETTPL